MLTWNPRFVRYASRRLAIKLLQIWKMESGLPLMAGPDSPLFLGRATLRVSLIAMAPVYKLSLSDEQ
jgi:hypothetical protein